VTGEIYDRTHSYDLAFQVSIGLAILSMLAILQIRMPAKVTSPAGGAALLGVMEDTTAARGAG